MKAHIHYATCMISQLIILSFNQGSYQLTCMFAQQYDSSDSIMMTEFWLKYSYVVKSHHKVHVHQFPHAWFIALKADLFTTKYFNRPLFFSCNSDSIFSLCTLA